MKTFEEINIRHRIRKYEGFFKRRVTVPYQDFDLLERIYVMNAAQAALILLEENFEEYKEQIISTLHDLYLFSDDIWEEGKYQHQYSHRVTMDNLRLRKENEGLKKEVENLKKQMAF